VRFVMTKKTLVQVISQHVWSYSVNYHSTNVPYSYSLIYRGNPYSPDLRDPPNKPE